jgi:hypothetical protein
VLVILLWNCVRGFVMFPFSTANTYPIAVKMQWSIKFSNASSNGWNSMTLLNE